MLKLLVKNGFKINLHSLPFENQADIENYLSFAVELSKITNDKINIVYHPVETSNYKDSIDKTKDIIKQVFKCIEYNNYSKYIDISIENLNDLGQLVRLKKENLIEILNTEPNLKFTYDIGHEIVDNIVTKELPKILKERLNNIHIHTHKTQKDHYPIEKMDNEKDLKNLLMQYGKKQNVVMAYALAHIEGENFEKKLENYINYAKIIKY